ncbi:MAG: hypothetical protein Q7S37_02915 [bacterium]|nr:hypothetical protein [bacterium]
MVISDKLIRELKQIIKEEYGEELDDDGAKTIGEQLLRSYEALIKLEQSNKSD